MSSRIAAESRLKDLLKLQCWIFNKPFNPNGARIATKVLLKPLKGEHLKSYYYPSLKLLPTPAKLNKIFDDWTCVNPEEVRRLERNEFLRRKGKGPPKKSKEKKVADQKKK